MLTKLCCFCIRLYWKFIPEESRRVCLYKESCSRYIYRIFQEEGLIAGIKAVIYRFKNCKKDYNVISRDNSIFIETRTGSLIDEQNISVAVLRASQAIIETSINRINPQKYEVKQKE